MPVADSKKLTVEIVSKGVIADGGAGIRPCLNVFHFRRDNNTNTLNKANIGAQFDSVVFPSIIAELSNDYSCDTLQVRFLEDNLDAYQDVTVAEVGGVGTARAPDYQCVTVQLKTNVRGRNYRGSKHLSPIAEADTDGDVIAAARLAAWGSVATACGMPFTDASANVWTPFVWSRELSTLAGDLWTIEGAVVNSTVLNTILGTVRSRKPR